MRKLLVAIFLFAICVLAGFWSPWLGINIDVTDIFGVEKPESIASLQVYSLSGELQVFIDGKLQDKTAKENELFIVDKVEPKEHLITLKRVTPVKNSYVEFTDLVTFEEGTDVVVSYNLAPKDQITYGHIIYAVPKESITNENKLKISLNVLDAVVLVDNVPANSISSNLYVSNLDLNSQHTLSISKPGYETLEFTILPTTQEDRDKLKNYDILVEAKLGLTPVTVE